MKERTASPILIVCVAAVLCGCTMSSGGPSGPTGSSLKNVKLIAGQAGVPGSQNGTGGGATFYYPAGVALVGTTLYVADSNNSIIRQVDPATGAVSTFAGAGYSGWANGIGTAAVFDFPEGITTDGTSLYVADSGSNVIRKITVPGAVVTTIAGTPGAVGSQDSAGATPSNPVAFNNPLGITYAGGNLYVSDSGNSTIRQVTLAGVVTTYAGNAAVPGFADSPVGTSASFQFPEGLTTDGANLYVVDTGNYVVRSISLSGSAPVLTIAGQPGIKGSADGAGGAATFDWPEGIAYIGGATPSLAIADTVNCTIRQLVIGTGVVSTLAGQGGVSGSADGTGNVATFNDPMGLAVNVATLYVTDMFNCTIRQVQ